MEVDDEEEDHIGELSSLICDLGERANAASRNLEKAIYRYPEGWKEEAPDVMIGMQIYLKELPATPQGE